MCLNSRSYTSIFIYKHTYTLLQLLLPCIVTTMVSLVRSLLVIIALLLLLIVVIVCAANVVVGAANVVVQATSASNTGHNWETTRVLCTLTITL